MCLGARVFVFVFARLDLRGGVFVLCVCCACVYMCAWLGACAYACNTWLGACLYVCVVGRVVYICVCAARVHTHTTPNGLGAENKGSGANQAHANTQTQTRKRNSHTQKQRAPVQKTQTTRSTTHTDFRSYPGSSHTASKHSNRWSEQV